MDGFRDPWKESSSYLRRNLDKRFLVRIYWGARQYEKAGASASDCGSFHPLNPR